MWLDFVMVLRESRILFCTIAKNGMTVATRLAGKSERLKRQAQFFQFAPQWTGMRYAVFLDALRHDRSWRKVVVYRDPMERFLSAFHSKCQLRDFDGRKHCHQLFGLNDTEVSLLAVARRLKRFGHTNPHWAPQSRFCGNTVGPQWSDYTDHIPFHRFPSVVDLLAEHLSPLEGLELHQEFNRSKRVRRPGDGYKGVGSGARHVTNAAGTLRHELNPEVGWLLFDYYTEDYRLFHSNFLYELLGNSTSAAGA